MPDFINALQTQDNYVPALTLGPTPGVKRFNFSVLPAAGQTVADPVLFTFWKYPLLSSGLFDYDNRGTVLELFERIAVGNTIGAIARGAAGIRFRSAIVGKPALIYAEMVYGKGDPLGPDIELDAGNVTAAAISSTGQTGGGSVALANFQNQLGADQPIGAGFTTGPSQALPAGTWLIVATLFLSHTGNSSFTSRLWDGATAWASTEGTFFGAGVNESQTLVAIVKLPVAATVSAQVASTSGAGTIRAATVDSPQGNTASTLTCTQIA